MSNQREQEELDRLKNMTVEDALEYMNAHWFTVTETATTAGRGLRSDLSDEQRQFYFDSVGKYWTPERMRNAIPD